MTKRRKSSAQVKVSFLRRLYDLHGRLLTSAVLGIAAIFLFPQDWHLATRLLAGWDIGIGFYLIRVAFMAAREDVQQIRRRACVEDEGAVVVLLGSMLAAFASLAAIVAFLGGTKIGGHHPSGLQVAFAMSTIVLSWMFLHAIFTLHYAHEYYGERGDHATGGLQFPGSAGPNYWDFLYFSLVIAMTSQVSDVPVTSRVIRRVVTMHAALSFFFNLTILALTVNMLAEAVGGG